MGSQTRKKEESAGSRARVRRAAAVPPIAVFLLTPFFVAPCGLASDGYRFIFQEVTALADSTITFDILGSHERPAQGFSMAARYPAANLTVEEVHERGTILESMEVDFFEAFIEPEQGFFTVGVLVDIHPPFENDLLPTLPYALPFVKVRAKVAANAPEVLTVRLTDGLSRPPIQNVYVIDNLSVPVDELSQGTIRVPRAEPLFLRGDANMDQHVDLSDAVGILDYKYSGGRVLRCLCSGDANDDDALDLSDAVRILMYLFLAGPRPAAPFPGPGVDPTPGRLNCIQPLN